MSAAQMANIATRAPLDHDYDWDGDVDLADYLAFVACFNGAGGSTADCEVFDADEDGDVDLADFADLQLVFTGAL